MTQTQRVQRNLKLEEETDNRLNDLMKAGHRNRTDTLRFLIDQAWNLLEKAQQMGDEPKVETK